MVLLSMSHFGNFLNSSNASHTCLQPCSAHNSRKMVETRHRARPESSFRLLHEYTKLSCRAASTNSEIDVQATVDLGTETPNGGESVADTANSIGTSGNEESLTKSTQAGKFVQVILLLYQPERPTFLEFFMTDRRRNRLTEKHNVEAVAAMTKAGKSTSLRIRGDDVDNISAFLESIISEAEQEGATIFYKTEKQNARMIRMLVPYKLCSALIGPQGTIIKAINNATGASMRFQPADRKRSSTSQNPGEYSETRLLTIDIDPNWRAAVAGFREILRRLVSTGEFGSEEKPIDKRIQQ